MSKLAFIKKDIDWKLVKNLCRTTVGKIHTAKEPSDEFIEDILISEHSPIRLIRLLWHWEDLKSWISVHFTRHHEGVEKFVSTQRMDRTGNNRDESPQDTPVIMDMEANAQALINMGRVRLCYQAAPETRQEYEALKMAIHEEADTHLADVIVPNCVYRCGCPEMGGCKFWETLSCGVSPEILFNIKERYKIYNTYFYQNVGN